MKLRISSLLAAAVMLTSSGLMAAQTEEAVQATIENKLELDVQSVAKAPVDGFYEVVTARGILYVAEDLSTFFHGQLYSLDDELTNLTEVRLTEIRKSLIANVQDSVIEFKAPKEKYVVNVFTDVDCGYCQKMHDEIDGYNKIGITIRYLAWPRSGRGGKTWTQMESVWCAKDPRVAMTTAKAGSNVSAARCDKADAVAQHFKLGQRLGVSGTPSMVFADGSMVPGYMPPSRLLKALQTQ